jgi:hypothetical protein
VSMRQPFVPGLPRGDPRGVPTSTYWEPAEAKRRSVSSITSTYSCARQRFGPPGTPRKQSKKKKSSKAQNAPAPTATYRGPVHAKGMWSFNEDLLLIDAINRTPPLPDGRANWAAVASIVGVRSHKQCRERFTNHLDPTLSKLSALPDEIEYIDFLVHQFGPSWAAIAILVNDWRAAKGLDGKRTAAQLRRWHVKEDRVQTDSAMKAVVDAAEAVLETERFDTAYTSTLCDTANTTVHIIDAKAVHTESYGDDDELISLRELSMDLSFSNNDACEDDPKANDAPKGKRLRAKAPAKGAKKQKPSQSQPQSQSQSQSHPQPQPNPPRPPTPPTRPDTPRTEQLMCREVLKGGKRMRMVLDFDAAKRSKVREFFAHINAAMNTTKTQATQTAA